MVFGALEFTKTVYTLGTVISYLIEILKDRYVDIFGGLHGLTGEDADTESDVGTIFCLGPLDASKHFPSDRKDGRSYSIRRPMAGCLG
jgi:hypothetical protein